MNLTTKGFSLVELLVVVSIFVILTSVVLFNQDRFSSEISLSNVTHAIALDIRKAQVYGTVVRGDGSNNFDSAFGIHYEQDAGSNIVYSLFSDDNKDGLYTSGGDEVFLPPTTLGEGNLIDKVCTFKGSDEDCLERGGGGALASIDILFKRPDPAAIITTDVDGVAVNQRKDRVEITVVSALRDRKRIITVSSSGQISVGQTVTTN